MSERKFFAELKQRNVYKVAIAYGVVAWLLMQVASQIFRSSKFQTGQSGWSSAAYQLTHPDKIHGSRSLSRNRPVFSALVTPRPIPCPFCDRQSQMCCFLRASTTGRAILR